MKSSPQNNNPSRSTAARTWFAAAVFVIAAPSASSAQLDAGQVPRTLRHKYVPDWHAAPVLNEQSLDYDTQLSETANGARLKDRIEDLVPGDLLRVGAGRWSVNSYFQVDLQGTADAPIRIVGAEGAILTRPNAGQNVINFGSTSHSSTRYLLLRGFEITGGSNGIRVQNAEQFWIDRCHVHHVASVGIGANSHDTDGLRVTRTEVSHTGATGEGMYLGGNYGSVICRNGVFALNHVHDMGGDQGDGIELKGGSYGCLIAENVVHGTNFPGIIVYGTEGNPVNIVEGNVIWDVNTNALQVQGEAIVRNNLVFGTNGSALQSGPHQGLTTNLKVIGNTFISTASPQAAFLRSWSGQPGMVFANNVIYSENGESVHVNGGLDGVTVENNVVLGPLWGIPSSGFFAGNGLSDFVDLSWDATRRDARPSGSSALNRHVTPSNIWSNDLTGAVRPAGATVGALEPGTYGRYLGPWTASSPSLRTRVPLVTGAASYEITVEAEPFSNVWLLASPTQGGAGSPAQVTQFAAALLHSGLTDASGRATITLDSSTLPQTVGQELLIRASSTGSNGSAAARRLVLTAR